MYKAANKDFEMSFYCIYIEQFRNIHLHKYFVCFLNVYNNVLDASATVTALPIISFSELDVGGTVICGMPQMLAWDPTGSFLAISFKDHNIIIIYSTSIHKYRLNISSHGFISPPNDDEHPSCMCFQSVNQLNSTIVLTVGWSNGRVAYYNLNSM